jgi:folylpolyglutamate synthase/dihydrofolate synthase
MRRARGRSGGLYDAVNAVTPMAAAIASISLDHMQTLGNTLGAIAFQKAGIIKPRVPAVTLPQHPEAEAVLVQVARPDCSIAPLFVATPDGLLDPAQDTLSPYPAPITPATVGLLGTVQLENARLASGIGLLLRQKGMTVPDAAFAAGLLTVLWPARLEVLQEKPFIVADGAHNGDSAQKLADALRQVFDFERLILVLGASTDKDSAAIAGGLVPVASTTVLTRSHHGRAAGPARRASPNRERCRGAHGSTGAGNGGGSHLHYRFALSCRCRTRVVWTRNAGVRSHRSHLVWQSDRGEVANPFCFGELGDVHRAALVGCCLDGEPLLASYGTL